MTGPYYEQVSQAFDQAAKNYDELYQNNGIMAWMRAESLGLLESVFRPGSRLLEIGCGTGDEAIALAHRGYQVVASDISAAMIESARAKSQANGVEAVTWHVLPAGQLFELSRHYADGSFDGAYSSFGALNCEPHLADLAPALGRLLPPGAWSVFSVMSRWCVWEIGWGLLHLRLRQAFRRINNGWIAAGLASSQERLSVPVQYYNPRSFARTLAPHFALRQVRALPVAVPPPDLDGLMARHPGLFARLKRLDRNLRQRFPFHTLGDHFVAVMQHTGRDARP